jgi:hypothetical protein
MANVIDKALLYKIMHKVGEIEAPLLADTTDFLDLIGKDPNHIELKDMLYLDRHLEFLRDCDFVSLGAPTMAERERVVTLTKQGRMFLQPELAEFGHESLLPDIIKALEQRIVLSYPEEERNGVLYRIREAVSKQSGDLILKAIEIGLRMSQSQ